MRRCVLKDITAGQFTELHIVQQKTLKEIAEYFGVSADNLSIHVRKKLGLEIIYYRIKWDDKITEEFKDRVVNLYVELKSSVDVAVKLNINRRLILRILKSRNINVKYYSSVNQSSKLKFKTFRTNSEYATYCNSVGITPLESYVGVNHRILHKCNACSNTWDAFPHNIIHNKSACPKCAMAANAKGRSLEPGVYRDRLNKLCPNLEVLEDYITYSAKILHKCKTCGYVWKTLPINKLTISGCRRCVTPSGNFGTKTIVDGIEFDSALESRCYSELLKCFNKTDIIHKRWYNQHYCSDFYIPKLDLWVEVSSFNTKEYLEKIYNKRQLVKNFVFFCNESQVTGYFKEKKW